jgi:hypothetical protein
MDITTFKASLEREVPPEGLGCALQALWYQAKGDWDQAHRLAQAQKDANGAWVHAFLHRVEGDSFNAGYWYRRAGKPHAQAPFTEEWAEIASSLLAEQLLDEPDQP